MEKLFLSLFIIIHLSCNNKSKNDHQSQTNVPDALLEKESSGMLNISKRGPEDLVDELYKEKLEKTPELLSIDKLYRELKENKTDSLEEFNNYTQKNNSYYESAGLYLKRIQDSLLKKEIETTLTNSINRFNANSEQLTALRNALVRAEVSTNDRYIVVKLLVTLRMMEFYQDKLPPTKPIKAMIDNYHELDKKLDSVFRKNK